MGKIVQVVKAIDDATATATSAAIPIEGASKVVLVYKRSDHASGKTVFSATVSVDGTNYITYNKWITNVVNSNAQELTRVAEVDTGAANVTGFLTMSPEDGFKDIKVTATETTDGTHAVWLYIEY
jgi:hypothetical protein